METKEAIKWIFDIWHEWENVYGVDEEQVLKEGKKMDEVIELLQRGGKYEAMWGELRLSKKYSEAFEFRPPITMKELEEKYFPKDEADNDKTKIS